MPVTFAEDATGEEAKADVTRVTPDEKDGSARCETVKKVATELAGPSEKYCCCCCRGRKKDTPLARWASTPSFLTESLSTNNAPSMENEREPATPTTTEQPRPTNFDSVPSIPSDLF